MIPSIVIIFFSVVLVLFGFIDLYVRKNSATLLLKLDESMNKGKFIVDAEFAEVEVWLTTVLPGQIFKVIKANTEIVLDGPVSKTITFEQINRRYLWMEITQVKSVGKLELGTYMLTVKTDDTVKLKSVEVRGNK